MLFAVYCTDKPDHGHLRTGNRPAHLDFLKALGPRLKLAGPTLHDGTDQPNGSLIVIEAEDLAAAQQWAAGDPYAKAGLFSDVQVRPFRFALGHGF